MSRSTRKTAAALAALAALGLGAAGLAGAATKSASAGKAAHQRSANAEVELTGDTAASVRAAILAELPGATIQRMSTETDGRSTDAYEAHVTKADGTRVDVLLDSAFAVTAVDADTHPRGRGGRHGHGPHGRDNGETPVTGDALARLASAVTAAYPGATVDRAGTESDGKAGDGYEAHVTKADGSRIEVFLDASFKVTGSRADRR
jgi:uncharacterized membrane protein YkoI